MNVIQVLDFDTFEKSFQKKNVCAYARVSSLKDEQATSIDTQVEIYTNMIQDNPEWNFVGVFQDHGKSGTSTEKRTQFNMMIQIAKAGGIDLILTKSISRFARNTVDCLSTIQMLRKFGTEVWFEEDNLSSMDPKIEFVITVIAGMAQEESRNISDNVRWGVKKRFSEGIIPMVTSKILGYSRNKQGSIIVVDKEAKIVQLIFELYTKGMSQRKIAEYLNNLGYTTKFKGVPYHKTAISGVLNNEKYTGNALLQKTTYKEVGTRKKINYQDVLPQYYIENSHPAIITQEQFELAQSIKNKKIIKYNKTTDKKELMIIARRKTKYCKQVQCAHCGKFYVHKINNKGKQWERHHLICASNENKKTCKNDSIFTEVYDDVVKSIVDAICKDKNSFLDSLYNKLIIHPELLSLHHDVNATQERLSQINALLTQLIDKDNDFTNDMREKLKIEKKKLTTFKIELNNKLYTTHNIEVTFNNYKKIIKNLGNDAKNDIELFSKILIYNRNKIDFVLDPFEINSKKIGKILISTKTNYIIRRTTFTNKARIILK